MPNIEVKLRRGTTAQHSTFTGAEGEVTVDTDKDTVVVHDGVTAGGHELRKRSDASFAVLEVGNATAAYIDLKTPDTDDYDGRLISQADTATLETVHESRVRVESTSQLGFVAGADPSTATPGPEVMTIKETEVVVNEQGGDVDFRVEGNTNSNLIVADANENKVGIGGAVDSTNEIALYGDVIIKDSENLASLTIEQTGSTSGAIMYFKAPGNGNLRFTDTNATSGEQQMQLTVGNGQMLFQSLNDAGTAVLQNILRLDADGSVHIKSGTSIQADL